MDLLGYGTFRQKRIDAYMREDRMWNAFFNYDCVVTTAGIKAERAYLLARKRFR
ncbi:hypothetical protein DPMN_037802 [Dreissena polymorpha]|uniref:Uncharacterized protein n=1 Tax=Dreissena polymorpha TaxID=45954 RepID=A0A9D4MFZ8_DREPO|nr:hypothetical protein DPMN_037802 [Dreissena polymorpha]